MGKHLTYKTSGVDIDKADQFLKAVKGNITSTFNANVLNKVAAFGSLFNADFKKYHQPVLVSSTDGVGTKLLIARDLKRHDSVGIDLVAMNVNDILCTGALPLFFLDYIACGKIHVPVLKSVMKGIVAGCQMAGCSLIGGETAEMPGMYDANDYDLAGFAVGVVDRIKIIDGTKIRKGDCVIGLPSSGIHSNGYSLVRKVFSAAEQKKYAHVLMKPTRIYVKDVLPIIEKFPVKGLAHITGGAFY
jgi:phosphoribosylformylglycinamidine cyclo-ligase